MTDENHTPDELAASTVSAAAAAVAEAGRSPQSIAAAFVALAKREEQEGPKAAEFIVGFCRSFDEGVRKFTDKICGFLEEPVCRGRLDLATRLLSEHNFSVDLVRAVLLNIPRQSALEARMAEAAREPTVGGPAGAPRDPGRGWAAAVAKANEKLH
jgi:hypothetical protein